jgi:ubiquinone/menaquinone biosynthesis C-methylase UbiE
MGKAMAREPLQEHWDAIYRTKDTTTEVSWYQATPLTSLGLIAATGIGKSQPILDVGGGDSRLVDALLARGYTDITVLDIAPEALRKAQERLGARARQVTWIVADILDIPADRHVAVWHDRAAFHFLTAPEEIAQYAATASRHIQQDGFLLLGTFSTRGPEECSGLPVAHYSEETINEIFRSGFRHIRSFEEEHITPFQTMQMFLWTMFKRI